MEPVSALRGGAAALALVFLAGCTTNPYTGERQVSRTAAGATVGAATGAAIGAMTGRDRAKRALLGAGAGALAGAAVGAYMDVQEARLRERLARTGVAVRRDGDEILLSMPGHVTFDVDQSEVRPGFRGVLDSVALVLGEYDRTVIEVLGFTDSTGDADYNQALSERRAGSVGTHLLRAGIAPMRIVLGGYGEEFPVASNATAEGRRLNRRVELRLVPLTREARMSGRRP
jgi:outer membrane protein OmpA-like peptidoglycan-associated protein